MRKQDAVLARAERDKWKRFLNSIKNVKPKVYSFGFYICKFIIILFKYIDK